MGLFSRKPALPPNTAAVLDRYGRWAFDPQGSGIDPFSIGHDQLKEPVMRAYGSGTQAAEKAVDQLSEALAEQVLPVGGWPVYGAYRLVIDFRDEATHPADVKLMEAALEFLRSRGVPWNTHLSPFEQDFWITRHPGGAQEWIPWPEPPGPEEAPEELGEGEVRHMADIERPADGLINRLHFRHGADGAYEAAIFYPDRPEDQEPFVWFTEPSLHALSLRVGGALGTPPRWVSPELERFIPQPRMDLS